MSKRMIALLLCLVMCATALVSCAPRVKVDSKIKGAYVTMYLSDEVYNFDPAYAYMNEEAESIVSLMFSRLFTLTSTGTSKGKIKKDLVKEYEYKENEKTQEYTMTLTLRDAWWSDKIKVSADDVVFAWKRILNAENSFACASLLFDIKNARAAKAGNCSIDSIGLCALNDTTVEITFEKPIDYDQFLLNLTSLALAPLREEYVTKGEDWAKRSSTMVFSGPFKLSKIKYSDNTSVRYPDINGVSIDSATGEPVDYTEPHNEPEATYDLFVLERNAYYDRDPEDDKLDWNESVEPFRIVVSFIKSDEELLAAIRGTTSTTFTEREMDGTAIRDPETNTPLKTTIRDNIFYMGTIPLSLRTDSALMKKADITDALSTMSFYLNENITFENRAGDKVALFAIPEVRQALSMALDREAIAEALVLADPATGLVPSGIFNKGTKGDFRKEVGKLLETSAAMDAAKAKLAEAEGIRPSDYSFSIIVNANDDGHILLAEAAVAAWAELGFDVKVEKRGTIRNNDYYKPTASVPEDLCDELYAENILTGDYEVAIIDYCAYSADAYSMLAPFAADFSGMVNSDFEMVPHLTGYNSEKYNALIEAIYYLPYYNQISAKNYSSFMDYGSEEAFQAVLDQVAAVYEEYNIDTQKPENGRVTLLHAAEKLLMEELPIIPVVFNKNATVGTSSLKGVKNDLYTSFQFTTARLRNYQDYIEEFERIYTDFEMVYDDYYKKKK